MSYKTIIQSVFPSLKGQTPQTEPLPGQVANNAGGYFYAVDDWTLLDRFLILGTEAGTYYVTPVQLTKDNAAAIQRLLISDGIKVVERIVAISKAGRAPKNDPALFALALAAACEDQATRQAALAALPLVARTGTHLLQFADYVNNLRGWGRALRKAVGRWFTRNAFGATDLAGGEVLSARGMVAARFAALVPSQMRVRSGAPRAAELDCQT